MPANPVAGVIKTVEYFFDTDPGFGNGHIVNIPVPSTDVNTFSIVTDVSGLNDSTHTLYVRAYDDWGITNTKTFTKGLTLPLTWLTFNATAGTGNVLLNWKTVNEINGNYFDVERSTDGITFTKIGAVNAANNTNTQTYPFTDNAPLQGISYYRIKQVDKDGKYSYSATIAIRFGKNNPPVMVYPNPAREIVNILFDKPQQKNSSIELISNSGQAIQIISVDGLQSKQINVSALPSGTYQLRITTGTGVSTQKIIVQH
ncbi:MAG: T9SS type A sorting domain-containing protein [Ferruginibacter sp.]